MSLIDVMDGAIGLSSARNITVNHHRPLHRCSLSRGVSVDRFHADTVNPGPQIGFREVRDGCDGSESVTVLVCIRVFLDARVCDMPKLLHTSLNRFVVLLDANGTNQ